MAFRVHALLIPVIVAALQFVCRTLRRASAPSATRQKPDTRADARTAAVAPDGGSSERTDRRADYGAAHPGVFRGLGSGCPADLRVRILPAIIIVQSKLVETFAGAGQHHNTRTGRHRDAAGDRQ
jgi:hypothetical protein